jgi:hypothetical protein
MVDAAADGDNVVCLAGMLLDFSVSLFIPVVLDNPLQKDKQ